MATLFFWWLQTKPWDSSITLFFLSHPTSNPSANLAASTSTKQPDLILLATYTDSNLGSAYHDSSVLPDSSLLPFRRFSTEHQRDPVNKQDRSHCCSIQNSESFSSLSAWTWNSFKRNTKPHMVQTLSPSILATLRHPQTLNPAPVSEPLPFLLSLPALLVPQVFTCPPTTCLYSNVTSSVRDFQTIILTITPSTLKTSYPLLSFIFLQCTIASQAVHVPPRSRRKLNHSWK